MDYFAIWRYFGWVFGVLSLGSLALRQWGLVDSAPLFLHRPEKVDTEKIFQLNNFSKVDNSDNFV